MGEAITNKTELLPFADKVLCKLRRFEECADDCDADGVDIGRDWLDILTKLGLLNRVQRSPAFWEISEDGELALAAPAEYVRAVGDEPVAWMTRCIKGERKGVVEEVAGPDDVGNLDYWSPAFPVFARPQRRLEMADVVRAHMEIPHCPVLTSNQCHALAVKLNACLDEIERLNK